MAHEDNQVVVSIINTTVSASSDIISELWKLQKMCHGLEINVQSKWIPSAVNRFVESLLRTWDPVDIRVSRHLLRFVCQQYFDSPLFVLIPLSEPAQAMLKKIKAQLDQPWNDGKDCLWNTTFDFIPLILRKIEQEQASGILIVP